MSKAKHVMVSNGTASCGRSIEVNGTGAECKQCAARVARNAERVAAMVPSGNGLVEAHGVQVEACTLDNGDTVYVGKCEHGWQTGFHTTEGDAHDVAAGHGEVTRALYAPPVAVEVIPPALTDEVIAAHGMDAADIAEYNVQRSADIESAVMTAQKAITDNRRVFVAEAHNFGGRAAFDALVASGWAYLVKDGDMSRYVRNVIKPGDVWSLAAIEARAAAEQPIREAYIKSQREHEERHAELRSEGMPTQASLPKVGDVVDMRTVDDPNQVSAPTIPGYYWARHNGHTSVENGPTVRTTDAYQLIKDGTTCQVAATISHVSGFRWRPSGCVWINTGLSSGWDGVPLADAFARVQTYMQEVAHVRATDPTNHHARMSAGDVARSGLPFISAHEVRLIADTPSKAAVVAVGDISKPTRTKLAKRARKALSRKHKPSKVHRG